MQTGAQCACWFDAAAMFAHECAWDQLQTSAVRHHKALHKELHPVFCCPVFCCTEATATAMHQALMRLLDMFVPIFKD
jgi:hypothetical protein